MSTDNIDIVLNELDSLVNIDFKQRMVKTELTQLELVRIGTAGGLQAHIPIDSIVVSEYGIGLDGLGNFYHLPVSSAEQAIRDNFLAHVTHPSLTTTYVASGSSMLIERLKVDVHTGITVTCPGFYGPQGRTLRAKPLINDLIEKLQTFNWQDQSIANFEMETAGLYAMGSILQHHCCSVSAIVANRVNQQFSAEPTQAVENAIQYVLDKL
jgi:uridine phosphorylase